MLLGLLGAEPDGIVGPGLLRVPVAGLNGVGLDKNGLPPVLLGAETGEDVLPPLELGLLGAGPEGVELPSVLPGLLETEPDGVYPGLLTPGLAVIGLAGLAGAVFGEAGPVGAGVLTGDAVTPTAGVKVGPEGDVAAGGTRLAGSPVVEGEGDLALFAGDPGVVGPPAPFGALPGAEGEFVERGAADPGEAGPEEAGGVDPGGAPGDCLGELTLGGVVAPEGLDALPGVATGTTGEAGETGTLGHRPQVICRPARKSMMSTGHSLRQSSSKSTKQHLSGK